MLSLFFQVHTKKRNRLDQQKLNDLVFVKYNRALKCQYDDRDRIDPISLQDIDDANEWLMGTLEQEQGDDELVFGDDDLTWDAVERAAGVDESAYTTRGRGGGKGINTSASSSRPSKGKEKAMKPSFASLRTPLISRDGNDEEENLGDDYFDEENDEFEEKFDGVGDDDNYEALDGFEYVDDESD